MEVWKGRITAQYKDYYRVRVEEREMLAEISGKLRHQAEEKYEYPVVGDFVEMDRNNDQEGTAIIQSILPRSSLFLRREAGNSHQAQPIAANIDIVFICMSLNRDFNLRRLERYLSIAWDSGSKPVVVLTKSDLVENGEERRWEAERVAMGVDVLVTSSMKEDGYQTILPYLEQGVTVALIGSSGVGKSTLINRLLGEEHLPTGELRNDDKGKHITTRRELFVLENGACVIDTPGMRELGLEQADVGKVFEEIEELAKECRFSNCQHQEEPGCAVKKAIQEGRLEEGRLASYQKLQKEAKYEGLDSRQIEKEKIRRMFEEFDGVKNARDYIKSKKDRYK